MRKWAKIKAADVLEIHQRQGAENQCKGAFCGTVIITGFCPSVQSRREK